MEDLFTVECPCCGAALEIDSETQTILSHKAVERRSGPESLQDAVQRLKSEENSRDERFREQFEAEKKHEKTRERRFDGLLKKAKSEGPPKRVLRDIDLD